MPSMMTLTVSQFRSCCANHIRVVWV
jgi:hypothetical protein